MRPRDQRAVAEGASQELASADIVYSELNGESRTDNRLTLTSAPGLRFAKWLPQGDREDCWCKRAELLAIGARCFECVCNRHETPSSNILRFAARSCGKMSA